MLIPQNKAIIFIFLGAIALTFAWKGQVNEAYGIVLIFATALNPKE